MEKPDVHCVFVVADATGETAAKMSQAALAQFPVEGLQMIRRYNVRTEPQIAEVLEEVEDRQGLIIFTFASNALRSKLLKGAQKAALPAVDLLGPLFSALTLFLKMAPHSEPGRVHRIDTGYFGRVEAVQYTVKHDDGQNLSGIRDADVLLVGPSRTAKTPLSIYLAQFGYKVANVPIILHLPLPKEIEEIVPVRVVGLLIDPQRLMEIRESRLRRLNQKIPGYADLAIIEEELAFCREIYRNHPKWMILDVTGRAIEEVATDLMSAIPREEPAP